MNEKPNTPGRREALPKPQIPTAKVRKMIENPFISIEVPAVKTWGGEPVSRETQLNELEEMKRSIQRHIDNVGDIRIVANYRLVCKWCDNPADDCDPDGTPICCDEALEEFDMKYRHLTEKEA